MMLQKVLIIAVLIPCIFSARLYYKSDTKNSLYTICSKDDDGKRMSVKAVSIQPNPPKKGEDVNFNISLNLLEEVTSGEVKVSLNYGTIPVIDETLDLCDLVTQINKKCPLNKGELNFGTKENIPDYIPSGVYSGKVTMTDQNGQELICLELKLKLD